MSIKAVTWALGQTLASPADTGTKLVLVALANLANDKTHQAFPGRQHLADVTLQEVDKVNSDLRALSDAYLIADTGKRVGDRRRTIVWVLGVEGPVRSAAQRDEDLPI